jgi:hypothetical protein
MKAFPTHREEGMELRDYFAAAALPAVITDPDTQKTAQITKQEFQLCVAVIAYRMADAMISAREVK